MSKGQIETRRRGANIMREGCKLFMRLEAKQEGQRWPAVKYQHDPGGFVKEVLKQLFMPHQVEITEAVRDHDKVAVSSGQKIGKTHLLACLILWWWCCFPEASVTLMMTTKGQLVDVIWREIRKIILYTHRTTGVDILADAKMAADPAGGLRSADGMRIVIGKSVQQIEALGGISGPAMLFVVDEASFMSQRIFEALMGNTKGGAKVLCTSNPTRPNGPFFDIFHRYTLQQNPAYGWWTKIYSSRDVAESNARLGLKIPGVATVEKCDEDLALYGANHPAYIIRTLGQFLKSEQGKICTWHAIQAAKERWASASDWDGHLVIGCDPAGKSEGSDAWGFAVLRGNKCLEVSQRQGISQEAGLAEVERLLERYRQGDEIPAVHVDCEGPIGAPFDAKCRNRSEQLLATDRNKAFTYHGVKSSQYAARTAQSWDTVRDELWGTLADWLSEGAIPADYLLEAELYAPSWIEVQVTRGGARLSLIKATPKDVLRSPEVLGRSPNLADALGLAVYTPRHLRDLPAPPDPPWRTQEAPPQDPRELSTLSGGWSPYDLLDASMGQSPRRG